MASSAVNAQGVALKRGDGATPTEGFTLIGEIHDWSGPKKTGKTIEVTSLDSTAKEYIVGLVDYGEITFNGNWVGKDAQQQGLNADLDDRVLRNFTLTFTDGHPTASPVVAPTTCAFSGYVMSFEIKGGVDNKIDFSCGIKITGKPTFTYAAS